MEERERETTQGLCCRDVVSFWPLGQFTACTLLCVCVCVCRCVCVCVCVRVYVYMRGRFSDCVWHFKNCCFCFQACEATAKIKTNLLIVYLKPLLRIRKKWNVGLWLVFFAIWKLFTFSHFNNLATDAAMG